MWRSPSSDSAGVRGRAVRLSRPSAASISRRKRFPSRNPAALGRIPEGRQHLITQSVGGDRAVGALARLRVRPEPHIGLMLADERIASAQGVAGVAGPRMVLRSRDHPGPQGVGLDVAIAGHHVALGIHDGRLEPALPQRPRAAPYPVDAANVAAPQRLHQPTDPVVSRRSDQQVHMVGHQHICVQGAALLCQSPADLGQEEAAVAVVEEDRLPIVAALDDVVGLAGEHQARGAGHDGLHIGRGKAKLGRLVSVVSDPFIPEGD